MAASVSDSESDGWITTVDFYNAMVSEAADAATGRNQFIEWTFGLVGGVLVVSLLSVRTFPLAAWFGATMTLLLILPLLKLAVDGHSTCRRTTTIALHLLGLQGSAHPKNPAEYPDHVIEIVRRIGYLEITPERQRSLYWNVMKMGFLYLGAACMTSFAILSYLLIARGPDKFPTPWPSESTLIFLSLIAVIVISLWQSIGILKMNKKRDGDWNRLKQYMRESGCEICVIQAAARTPCAVMLGLKKNPK